MSPDQLSAAFVLGAMALGFLTLLLLCMAVCKMFFGGDDEE